MDTYKDFEKTLRVTNAREQALHAADRIFRAQIILLRTKCPHLKIAEAGGGGKLTRVCQDCGIQEIEWRVSFQTLTAPGDSRFDRNDDPSKVRRQGKHPVIYPMSQNEAFKFRRGPHLDVSGAPMKNSGPIPLGDREAA